ncbi:MAG: LamG domain-containing protein [Ignavibacteria bacterium]|nr:LamG domain-containing protein [Ignavibacteria bacterium]
MNFLKDNFKIFALIFILINSNNSNAQMFWNQSCQFTGGNNSYISVTNSTDVNLTGDFTLETWVNPTSVTGTEKGIISKGSTLGLSLRYALKISTTGRVTISTNGLLILTSTSALTANAWTHVCATFNSTTDSFAIYINGVKNIGAVIGSAEPSSNTDSLYVGIAGSGLGFAGQLDEVRLWNKSLTATQISQYFRTSLGATGGRLYEGLVLSLPFQRNNSGGTVFTTEDNTGNGHHGKGRNVTADNQTGTNYRTICDNESLNLFGTGEYVAGPNSALISPTSQITLEAWIFPRNLTSSPSIISKNSATSYNLGVSSTGKVNFIPKGGAQILESKSVVIPARWTHIAATYNGSTTSLYINGVLDTSTNSIGGSIGSNTDSLIIGGDRTGAPVTNFLTVSLMK